MDSGVRKRRGDISFEWTVSTADTKKENKTNLESLCQESCLSNKVYQKHLYMEIMYKSKFK